MTRRERELRAAVRARAADMVIAVDAELDTMFQFPVGYWPKVGAHVDAVMALARNWVDKSCADLDVPPWARPEIPEVIWHRRGAEAVADRRRALRHRAERHVDELERRALLDIKRRADDPDALAAWSVDAAMPAFSAAELERTT